MGQRKRSFTAEFKSEAVRLVRTSDKALSQVAEDIGVSESALRRWEKQVGINEGNGPAGALTTNEREELTRLRRECRQAKLERDFLKKAAAFFASEPNSGRMS